MATLPTPSSFSLAYHPWARRLRRSKTALAVAAVFCGVLTGGLATEQRVLLSTEGSGRATAYIESPKIITYGGKTHVGWLDTPTEGFRARVSTFDHATETWSAPFDLGDAASNHGGPALTIDDEGYLHVLYYSHHDPFRYRRTVRPNDTSEWTEYEEVGYNLTYPALVCAADGTLIMTARRSYDDRPWELEMWTKRPGEDWVYARSLLRSGHPNYAQFAASLAWSPDHQTLHLSARIYEVPGDDPMISITTAGYLASDDNGETWRKSTGEKVELPATPATFDSFAHGRTSHNRVINVGSMAVDAEGVPHLVYGAKVGLSAQSYLVTPSAENGWKHVHLNSFLPPGFRDWDLFMHGGISFGRDNQPVIVGTLMHLREGSHEWGEPTTEIVVFRSVDDGETFSAKVLDEPNSESPRWMPNIERATGFNEIPDQLSFIYTDGVRGDGLQDILSNHVYWIR
jgi:hypothetical protein